MDAEPSRAREAARRDNEERLATEDEPRSLHLEATPALRVLVTGGEGFVGSHLIPRLLSRGHRVRATFHDPSGRGRRAAPGIDWRQVDLCREQEAHGLAEECDVVVHLAGLFTASARFTLARVHGTGTRHLVHEARRAGVRRLVHVSVLGAKPGGDGYFGTKFDAENAVIACGIPAVVLRPSIIYGPGDRFTSSIEHMLRRLPVFPMPGGGGFQLQPLAVEDMVDALCQCVERDDLHGRAFDVAGPERLTFREVVEIVAALTGSSCRLVRLPGRLALSAASLAHRAGFPAPFTREQLALFTAGSVLESRRNPLEDVFFLKPLPFRDALADYLEARDA